MANFNLDVAFDFAREKYSEKSPEIMASNSGCTYDEAENVIFLDYLGDTYKISYPEAEITYKDKSDDVDIRVKVLLLHYLVNASGLDLTGRKISFKEVPGGSIYIDPFNKRALMPFIGMFGENPDGFKKVAMALGGSPEKMGDVSFNIPVFPKVSVTFVLWLGDDEFAASGTILFDESAPGYLPTEDFAVIAQFTVFKMKALLANL